MSLFRSPQQSSRKDASPSRSRRARAVAEALERRRLLSTVTFLNTPVNSDRLTVLAAADFDNDLHPDVAAINASTHTLHVYRGNGDGTFALPTSASLGTLTPGAAVATDINVDGKPDLILTDATTNSVAVLLGNGTVRFAPAVTYAVGAAPAALAVADFNHDNRPDIITANSAAASFTVLLQSPTGSFDPAPLVPGTFNPTDLTVADFNNDNNPDVAAVGANANVQLLYGNGNGTFSTGTALIPGTTSHSSVVAGDFNKDGYIDLAVSQAGSTHQLAQLLSTDGRGFSVPTFIEVTSFGGRMIPGHFTGPAATDLLMTLPSGGVAFPRAYSAGGANGLAAATVVGNCPAGSTFATADFNGDGLTDFASTAQINASLNQIFFVRAQPLTLTLQSGDRIGSTQPNNITIARFTDVLQPDPSTLHPLIDWGDGRSSGATVVSDGGINYRVVASHTYLYSQTFQYAVSITDDFANNLSFSLSATVTVGTANTSASTRSNPISVTPFFPSRIKPDGAGNFWVAGNSVDAVYAAPDGSANHYTIPGAVGSSEPFVVDAQHNYWTVTYAGSLARVTPFGTVTTFNVPALASFALATGPDARIWFPLQDPDTYNANAFGQLTSVGNFSAVPFQHPLSGGATNMVLGPDGNFWVTETAPFIARVSPAGQVTEFPVSLPGGYTVYDGQQIVAGADGAIRFTAYSSENAAYYVVRAATDGQLTSVRLPTAPAGDLSAAPDGAIWFPAGDSVARINAQGSLTYYGIPTASPTLLLHPGIRGVAADAGDGRVWFVDGPNDLLGSVDVSKLLNISPVAAELDPGTDGIVSGPLITFTDPNGARPASDYAAAINWGDGTRTVATVTAGPNNSFVVSGNHTFQAQGRHNIGVSVYPPGDIGQTQYVGENIVPAPITQIATSPFVVRQNTPVNPQLPLLTFFDPDPNVPPGQFDVTISWGDFATTTGVVTAGAVPGQFVVTGQHTYSSAGHYNVTIRVVNAGEATLLAALPAVVYRGIGAYGQLQVPAGGSGFLATADLNDDGVPDLVSASQTTLSVLLGNGDNLFKPSLDSAIPAPAGNLILGDFNHDGRTDLAFPVVSNTPQTAILLGNGNGTFSPATTLAMSSTYSAVADFNGDHIPDLVGAGGPALQFLPGSATATFAPTDLPVSGQIDQLLAGDFNGDLKPDLALVTTASAVPQLVILLGNGDGTFGAPDAHTLALAGTGRLDLAAGDVDNDNATDLVVADASANQMIFLHGNGNGTFAPAAGGAVPLELTPSATPQLANLALVELNGDGNLDLLAADAADAQVRLRPGLADGTFAEEFPLSTAPRPLTGAALADFNGDGQPDLALGSAGTGVVTEFLNVAFNSSYSADSPIAGTPFSAPALFSFSAIYAPLDTNSATATIDWGDGTSSNATPLTSPTDPGVFTIGGSHLFKHPGLVTITARVRKGPFTVATAVISVYVTQATLVFSQPSRQYIYQQPATDAVATFHDPNPYSRPSDYSVVVNMGQGVTAPAAVIRDPYGGPGDFLVVVTQSSATSNGGYLILTHTDGITQRYNFFIGGSSPRNGGATISGKVFNDLSADGARQPGEPAQFGWRVFLDLNANGTFDYNEPSDMVAQSGTYTLADVPAGNAQVRLLTPAGWTFTPPTPSTGLIVVPVQTGQAITGINFSTTARPPVVTASRFDFDQNPRSVTFTFSAPVLGATAPGAYAVYSLDTGARIPVASATFDPDLNALTLNFATNPPAGNYIAVLHTAAITDALGRHLGANADGAGGADASMTFTALATAVTANVFYGTYAADVVTLSRNADGLHIDWSAAGGAHGSVLASDPAGLTFNGNGGADTLALDYSRGNPLPAFLRLNGAFTLTGLQGTNPLAGVTLDIGRSALYIAYASPATDPLAALTSYLKNGYNAGAWTGAPTPSTGVITSLDAALDTLHLTAVGYADAADAADGTGVNSVANTVLLKYTLVGDTDLDGTVGLSDYTAVVRNFGTGTDWAHGAVTYAPTVGLADYTAVVRNFGQSVPAAAHPSASAASISTAAAAAAGTSPVVAPTAAGTAPTKTEDPRTRTIAPRPAKPRHAPPPPPARPAKKHR